LWSAAWCIWPAARPRLCGARARLLLGAAPGLGRRRRLSDKDRTGLRVDGPVLTAQRRTMIPAGWRQLAGLFFGFDPFMREIVLPPCRRLHGMRDCFMRQCRQRPRET